MDLYTKLSTLSTNLRVDYLVYIGFEKNERFVDCVKERKIAEFLRNERDGQKVSELIK